MGRGSCFGESQEAGQEASLCMNTGHGSTACCWPQHLASPKSSLLGTNEEVQCLPVWKVDCGVELRVRAAADVDSTFQKVQFLIHLGCRLGFVFSASSCLTETCREQRDRQPKADQQLSNTST